MKNDIRGHLQMLASVSLSTWFVSWAWRRKYAASEKPEPKTQGLRWIRVILAYTGTFIPGRDLGWARVIFLIIGLVFVAWPDLADSLMGLFRSR